MVVIIKTKPETFCGKNFQPPAAQINQSLKTLCQQTESLFDKHDPLYNFNIISLVVILG